MQTASLLQLLKVTLNSMAMVTVSGRRQKLLPARQHLPPISTSTSPYQERRVPPALSRCILSLNKGVTVHLLVSNSNDTDVTAQCIQLNEESAGVLIITANSTFSHCRLTTTTAAEEDAG